MMSNNTEVQATYKYYQVENHNSKILNNQQLTLDSSSSNDSLLCVEIQNFFEGKTLEIEPTTQNIKENIFEEDLSIVVDKLVNLYFEETNKGKEERVRKQFVLNYFNYYKISLQEIYNWLLNNQTCSNSIYLLGYFNYHGIGIDINEQNAFKLYQKAAELENLLAQFDLSYIYICVKKDYDKAFKISEKLCKKKYPCGINRLGYCYEKGIGTEIDNQKTFELYKMAAELGNANGINNLGYCYEKGIGTEINEQKAFELYHKVADLGESFGINHLGNCYFNGIGTLANMQMAFELYQKAANLKYDVAQYNLALMYENGYGTEKNIDNAIYWYKKSAKQGYEHAQYKLNNLLK
jgi:TPR repeat protein